VKFNSSAQSYQVTEWNDYLSPSWVVLWQVSGDHLC